MGRIHESQKGDLDHTHFLEKHCSGQISIPLARGKVKGHNPSPDIQVKGTSSLLVSAQQ